MPNFVCVLTNKRYKVYRTGFLVLRLGHAPEVGLGCAGAHFFEHGHVAYQIDGNDE